MKHKETRFKYINGEPIRLFDLVAIGTYGSLFWFGLVSPKTLKYHTLHIITLGGSRVWGQTRTFVITGPDILMDWGTDFIASNIEGKIVKIDPDQLNKEMRINYDKLMKKINYESSADNT